MRYLRRNTHIKIDIGPFISDADGKTPISTPINGPFNVGVVNDVDFPTTVSVATQTPIHNRIRVTIPAANIVLVGFCTVWTKVTGSLIVSHEFTILPEAVYDAWFSGGTIDANLTKVTGVACSTHTAGNVPVDLSTVSTISQVNTVINYVDEVETLLKDGSNGLSAIKTDTNTIKTYTDTLETEVGKIVAKLPTVGYISGLNDILAIKNNTTFTTTMPDNAKMPKTGRFSFFVKSYIYDNAGEMELTKYGLGVRCRGADGRDLNGRLFKDKAMTIPAVAHPQYGVNGYVIAVPSGTQSGVFELYYESKAYDPVAGVFAEQITTEFMYQEDTSSMARFFGRSTMLILPDAGDATLADTSANMGVIAKAIRGYDSQAIPIDAGSIEARDRGDHENILNQFGPITVSLGVLVDDMNHIMPEINHIYTTVDTINIGVGTIVSKIDLIKVVTDALAIEVNKIVLKLPIGTDLISSLTLQTMNLKGISLSDSVDTVFAALRGRMDKDGTLLTFYGRDGAPLYRVNVATTGRTPI